MLTAWLTALAWRVVIDTSYARFVEDWMAKEPWYGIFGGALSSTCLLLGWSGLYFGIKYHETLQTQREETLRASALAQEAQVKMLHYQLNPHFLFNTLNAISTLILDNQRKVANQAVGRLSEFLRYTLDQDPMKKVTLRLHCDIDAAGDYMCLHAAGQTHVQPAVRPGDQAEPQFPRQGRAAARPRRCGAHLGLNPFSATAALAPASPSARRRFPRAPASPLPPPAGCRPRSVRATPRRTGRSAATRGHAACAPRCG
jgi:hypothetical protein